jgi:Fuc2NAc and GlcNAc transferase
VTLFFLSVLVGWVLTAIVRLSCLKWQVFDVPNLRSAHRVPMPTLGGVGLIVGFWVVLGIHRILNMPLPESVWGLLGASVVLCLLIRDEVRSMGRLEKLCVQVVAALVLVQGGVVLESVTLGDFVFEFGSWDFFVTVFLMLVLQNVYNFMDGLDGFAAQQGVLVSGILAILLWGDAPFMAGLLVGVCGVTLGFWFWNKPPARIFMGDVGAHFLPLCFMMGAVVGESTGAISFGLAILPLGAFVFDAVYTLIRRLLRKENITLAHRFHVYQRLQILGWTPWYINGIYALLTVILGGGAWLLQFGFVSVGYVLLGLSGLMVIGGTVYVERQYVVVERGDG